MTPKETSHQARRHQPRSGDRARPRGRLRTQSHQL